MAVCHRTMNTPSPSRAEKGKWSPAIAARKLAPISPPMTVPRTTVANAALGQRGRPNKNTLASTNEPKNPANANVAIMNAPEWRMPDTAMCHAIG